MNDGGVNRGQGDTVSAGLTVAVVVVDIERLRVGIPLEAVDEVHPMPLCSPLPGVPAVVEGVLDLRGEIVPVLDGRRRLGAPPRPVQASDRLVVLRARGRKVGIHVDAVADVAEVRLVDVSAARATAPELGAAGLGYFDGGLLIVHDADAFVTASEASGIARAVAELGRLTA